MTILRSDILSARSAARIKTAITPIARSQQAVSAFMSATLAAVLIASRFVNPDLLPGFCLFKMVTGIPCMFCGLTHAFHAISLGQFREAIGYHPLAFVAYALVVFHMLLFLARALDLKSRIPWLSTKPDTMLLATFGFFTFVWGYRLVASLL